MRAVLLSAFVLALLASCTSAMTLGSVSCPASNSAPTACYCTTGCGISGGTRKFSAPIFPPALVNASTMGSDVICAKITLPVLTTDNNLYALVSYLGAGGYSASKTEITVWTAFTAQQCQVFQALASAASASTPSAAGLYVNLCTGDSCNIVNSESFAVSPAPTAGNNKPSLLPGGCPVSNPSPTGCYCTNGCSINGDTTNFPWKSPVWPPAAVAATIVGTDTICAKITVPINTSIPAAVNLNAYLGIAGDVSRKGTSSVNGGYTGMVVTTYTAFTQAECANYIAAAKNLTDNYNVALGVELCNTEMCNSITSTSTSDARAVTFVFAALLAVIAAFAL